MRIKKYQTEVRRIIRLTTKLRCHTGRRIAADSFGKPGETVNVKLGLTFNHEGHEENTKGKDIAPLGLICWLAIIGYKDYAPMGLSGPGKSGGAVNVMLRMAP